MYIKKDPKGKTEIKNRNEYILLISNDNDRPLKCTEHPSLHCYTSSLQH